VSLAIKAEAISVPEPLCQSVSRLGAGFQHIETLAAELATLDAVNQDVWKTQALIRHDIAKAVLQTAFSLRDSKDAAAKPAEAAASPDSFKPDANVSDLWAKKLVKWADRFGRDLFGFSVARAPVKKKSTPTVPAPKQ